MAEPKENKNSTGKSEETEEKEGDKQPKGNAGGIFSPEGILMLVVAAIFDGIGWILLLLSWAMIDDYSITDILGIFIFGMWLLTTRGLAGIMMIAPDFLIAFGIESVPFLGSASPSWVGFVLKVFRKEKQ